MKKILFLVLALCVGYTSIAQVKQVAPKAWYNNVKVEASKAEHDPQPVYEQELNQYVTNTRAQDVVVGETWYDLQSNSSMAERIWTFDDGTMAAVWTRGIDAPAYDDRGTGYNYFDGTDWGPYPTERIEDERNGWPTIQPYGENGEIIVSHTGGAAGLVFSYRMDKGTGDWSHFYLTGPPSPADLLWPRMITTGENNDVIHVIACAGNAVEYEGLTMALMYSRSSDGGATWDPENVILDGMGSDVTSGWGGDDYVWAAPKGNTIAFAAFSGTKDGVIMKSTDGGDNWNRITFYESPYPFFDGNAGDIVDRYGGGDGYNALVLDDDGMAHVVFGRMTYLDDVPDDDSWSYYPYTDGLVYWNENMAPLDSAIMTAEIFPDDWSTHPLYLGGYLAGWVQPNGEDTISNVATYQASLSSMPTIAHHKDQNGVDIIQIFYGALSVGYVRPDDAKNNFRHVWGVYTEADGNFSEQTDYTNDIFHLFSECVYPSVSQNVVGGKYDILYHTDDIPGGSVQPINNPTHDPVLNNVVYLEVSPLQVDIAPELSTSFEVSQNQPNPALNETYVVVKTEAARTINFTVSNLLGQVVYRNLDDSQSSGTHTFKVDVSSFESGIYLYTVEVGTKAVTKKMLVK